MFEYNVVESQANFFLFRDKVYHFVKQRSLNLYNTVYVEDDILKV